MAAGSVIVSGTAEKVQDEVDLLELAVREHAHMVYRISFSVLRNHHDAEDATQEAFVEVLRYRRKLQGVRDCKTWLAQIAWRTAIDRKKKARQVATEPAIEQLRSDNAGPEEVAISIENMALLERLIAGLPNELRDAITLATVQDLSMLEIATILDSTEAAVRGRIFRARQILTDKVEILKGRHHGHR